MFHYGLGWPPDNRITANTCGVPAPMMNAMFDDINGIVHEGAHGLGLLHGGRPFAGSINFKPNYVSLMNYKYSLGGFSHGNFPIEGRVLNPTAVKELPGLGSTAGSSVLTALRDAWCPVTLYSSGNCVNLTTGAVDWNRDGVFEAFNVAVRGAVTQEFYSHHARTAFNPSTDKGPEQGVGIIADPALTWVSVGGAVGDQLWLFARDASNQLVWARTPRATLDAGCGSLFTSLAEGSTFNCAQFGNPTSRTGVTTTVLNPYAKALAYAPGAAEYNNKILVVYQPPSGTLKAMLVTINSSTGSVSYGAETTPLGPTGVTATGDVTAISTGTGDVTVWFPTGSGSSARLRQIRYLNGTWSSQGNQVWNDFANPPIVPIYGIGATRGFQDGASSPSTYAAIPVYPNGLVEFVRKEVNGNWSRVTITCPSSCPPGDLRCFGCQNVGGAWTASSWVGTGGACLATSTGRPCSDVVPMGTQPMAAARPGLAYQRKAGAANNVGRFYMAVTQGTVCTPPFGILNTWWTPQACASLLIMTEGNLTTGSPASKRLTWITPAQWLMEPNFPVVRGVSLVDDLTRDTNLRAAFGFGQYFNASDVRGEFEPLADGIINVDLKDVDDYAYLTGGMRASLCLEGGAWPGNAASPCFLTSLP